MQLERTLAEGEPLSFCGRPRFAGHLAEVAVELTLGCGCASAETVRRSRFRTPLNQVGGRATSSRRMNRLIRPEFHAVPGQVSIGDEQERRGGTMTNDDEYENPSARTQDLSGNPQSVRECTIIARGSRCKQDLTLTNRRDDFLDSFQARSLDGRTGTICWRS
jgi:hypothetical protein